jgi:GT2 family glycosyltransferase
VTLQVLVVSYRRADLLGALLGDLSRLHPDWPVHVWDNASDGSAEIGALAAKHPEVRWTFSPDNLGFAAAANRLVAAAPAGTDLLLLNPDARLLAPLTPLVEILATDPAAAAVAPLTRSQRQASWDVAHRRPRLVSSLVEYAGYAHRLRRWSWSGRYPQPPVRCDWASGSCLLIRRTAWEDVGPFDEQFWLYGEEVDWSLRAKKGGWHVRLVPQELVGHDAGATVGDDAKQSERSAALLRASQTLLLRRWSGAAAATAFGVGTAVIDLLQPAKRRQRAARAQDAARTQDAALAHDAAPADIAERAGAR